MNIDFSCHNRYTFCIGIACGEVPEENILNLFSTITKSFFSAAEGILNTAQRTTQNDRFMSSIQDGLCLLPHEMYAKKTLNTGELL
jgi:hypothetical protein